MSRDGKRGGGEREAEGCVCDEDGSLAICLDVEEKTVDGFNYG